MGADKDVGGLRADGRIAEAAQIDLQEGRHWGQHWPQSRHTRITINIITLPICFEGFFAMNLLYIYITVDYPCQAS